mgnify:CR=1 FL=1
MNITTPDKVEKLWHDWCWARVDEMTDEVLFSYALERMKQQYISCVYKHQGFVPDYQHLLEDIFAYYDGNKEEVESHLNMYDITLDKFDQHS